MATTSFAGGKQWITTIPSFLVLTQKSEYTSEILAGHTSEAFLPKQTPEREVSAVEKH